MIASDHFDSFSQSSFNSIIESSIFTIQSTVSYSTNVVKFNHYWIKTKTTKKFLCASGFSTEYQLDSEVCS